MTNNRIIWKTIHGLLAAAACAAASAALAAEPVANEMHTWNIQAEDAPAALRDFGVQSGVAISAEQKDIEGKRLNAVTGSLTVESALRQLVAGTGLKYVYDASGRAVFSNPVVATCSTLSSSAGDTLRQAASTPSSCSTKLVSRCVRACLIRALPNCSSGCTISSGRSSFSMRPSSTRRCDEHRRVSSYDPPTLPGRPSSPVVPAPVQLPVTPA